MGRLCIKKTTVRAKTKLIRRKSNPKVDNVYRVINTRLLLVVFLVLSVLIGYGSWYLLVPKPASVGVNEIKVSDVKKPEMWMLTSARATYNRELPADHLKMWTNPEEWSSSRKLMDVYFFNWKQTSTKVFEPEFLREKVIPLLSEDDIKIGLDTGFATWMSCKPMGEDAVKFDLDVINKIVAAGGRVSYISLQSAMGKVLPERIADSCPNYTYTDRINDMVTYVSAIRKHYPDIKIGLVDATAALVIRSRNSGRDTYQELFTQLSDTLKSRGHKLEFILLDNGSEMAKGEKYPGVMEYAQILELERFVKDKLKTKFGIIVTSSTGGINDGDLYLRNTLEYVRAYERLGGNPDFYMSESWHRYPEKVLPEIGGKEVTLSNVFLRVARLVNRISD